MSPLLWTLVLGASAIGAVVVAACIVVLFTRSRLQQHHRVDRSVATRAPLSWLVDPREPARLHRRLAKVGRAAAAVGDGHRTRARRLRRKRPDPPIVAVADDLRAKAVLLDEQLARLSYLSPRARHLPLLELGQAVSSLERAAIQLVALSAEVRAPRVLAGDDPALLDVTGQIERLVEAHQALLDLDAEAGLVSSNRVSSSPVASAPWSTPSS